MKAVAAKPLYLLVAPVVAVLLRLIEGIVGQFAGRLAGVLGGSAAGLVAGLAAQLIFAAALSLVLFVGRAIIEQRRLGLEDVRTGLGAFFNDMIALLFVFWIVSLLTDSVFHFPGTYLALFAVLLFPLFETAALAPVGSYAIFASAFRFFQRDALPWLFGQLPLLLLVIGVVLLQGAASFAVALIAYIAFWMVILIAFVYRGVLFLTLDNYSPRRRAERFGGAPGLGR
jgi:hypothetical protein